MLISGHYVKKRKTFTDACGAVLLRRAREHTTPSAVSRLDMAGEEAATSKHATASCSHASIGPVLLLVANAGGHGAAELMLKPFTMRFCSTACAEANAPDIIDITCLLASVSVACPRRTVRRLVQVSGLMVARTRGQWTGAVVWCGTWA